MSVAYARIQLLLQQHRYGMARQELEQLLQASPDEALAHALLAHCLSEERHGKRALVHARLAVGLAPEQPYCHYILAIVQQELGQLKDARKSILAALELDPHDPDYYTRLGLIALFESRWQESLDCAEQALRLNPEHIDSQNLRSMALIRLGQPGSALEQLDQALLKEPENALVHANRGWTLLHARQPAEAMDAFREALRLEPGLEWAREGMLEALKAQYRLYRIYQRYAFWMSRHGSKHQFLIMLLFILGARLMAGVIGGIMLVYLAFAAMTWLTEPFFNLLLLFHPFGRYVLAAHEKRGAWWFFGLLCGGLGLAVLSGLLGQPLGVFAGLMILALTVPTAATFSFGDAAKRRVLGGYTLGLAGLALLSLMGLLLQQPGLFGASFLLYMLGLVGASWLANWQMSRR